MTRRKRGEGSQPAEPVATTADLKPPKTGFYDDLTPAAADRLIALYDRLAQIEDHIRNAPHNEQYRQELAAIKRELGID